jgi:antitoxin HicB
MEPFKYRIVTEWSDEDQVFVSRVPALPGCSAHGDSPERAAKEARIAAGAILDVMREDNDPIPPPDASIDYSGKLGLRLPKSMHEQVARLAAADDVSINTKLLTLIAHGMGQRSEHDREKPAPVAKKRRTG